MTRPSIYPVLLAQTFPNRREMDCRLPPETDQGTQSTDDSQ